MALESRRESVLSKWAEKKETGTAESTLSRLMTREGIIPTEWTAQREQEAGLYPDIEDPEFSEKLTKKKEFYDAKAQPFSTTEKGDACSLAAFEAFTLSPIQRLVSRFMNPSTPFLGLLLYHGVGVGKTISAISIAENFLAERPMKRVSIIVPRSIAPGFKRTIFDPDVLRRATLDDPGRYVYKGWYSAQCTGTTYLKLVNASSIEETIGTVKPVAEVVQKEAPIVEKEAPLVVPKKTTKTIIGKSSAVNPPTIVSSTKPKLELLSNKTAPFSGMSKSEIATVTKFNQPKSAPAQYQTVEAAAEAVAEEAAEEEAEEEAVEEEAAVEEVVAAEAKYKEAKEEIIAVEKLLEVVKEANANHNKSQSQPNAVGVQPNLVPPQINIPQSQPNAVEVQPNLVPPQINIPQSQPNISLSSSTKLISIPIQEITEKVEVAKKKVEVAKNNLEVAKKKLEETKKKTLAENLNYNPLTSKRRETPTDTKEQIIYRIENLKRSRYSIKGYMAFKISIDKAYATGIPSTIKDADEIRRRKHEILRGFFNDGLIIIDEAHNLRQDPKTMTPDELAPDENPDAKAVEEGAEAKAIVPLLLDILMFTEGCRLVLMTATPMFNTAPEILFLLNLLILNDKKKIDLLKGELFDGKGFLKPDSEKIIKDIATRYVSYMRGENPFTFPIRLHPEVGDDALATAPYPERSALQGGKDIDVPEEIQQGIAALPIQRVAPVAGSICEKVTRFQMNVTEGEEETGEDVMEIGRRKNVLDAWAQIGNFTYPNERFGKEGWEEYFREEKRTVEWRSDTNIDEVFGPAALPNHGPKIAKILESVRTSKGINFIYSRYVQPGALPVCIALERAGYTRVNATGEPVPLLRGSSPVVRQCAMCPRKQHPQDGECPGFQPANYVLLTSDYTPNNVGATVAYATTFPAPVEMTARGSRVKVIVGSQIASEGLDLKCVREIHVLDPWYHLNRLEQVIGRGVRYCSHRQLPPTERNCLIHLYCLFLEDYETSDLYSYRLAVQKAKSIGLVQRQLKMGAWDCALNHEGILLTGDISQHHIDAQGKDLGEIQLADKANSSMCDYQECSFQCRLDIKSVREDDLNLSTFTARDARSYILLRESSLREMFSVQPFWPVSEVRQLYKELPAEVLTQALSVVINNRSFELRSNGQPGYLILRGGYVIFQPREITDTSIPLALRYKRSDPVDGKLWSKQILPPVGPFTQDLDERTRAIRPSSVAAALAAGAGEETLVDDGGSVATTRTTTSLSRSVPAGPESPIEWLDLVKGVYVQTDPFKLPVSADLKAKMKGLDELGIIAFRFKELVETKQVLLGFGWDHFYSYSTKQRLYTAYMNGKLTGNLGEFAPVMKKNIFKSEDINGYFLLDIKNNRIDTFCKRTGQMTYTACPSSLAPFVEAATTDASESEGYAGAPIVKISQRCGSLFGFLVAKPAQNILSAKTVENTPGGAITDGKDCAGDSKKEPHLERIRTLRKAVETYGDTDLLRVMYPLAPIVAEKKSAARKSFIEETSDMKQSTLCIYLEFMCRLMDARRVGGKRWFLNDVEFKRSYDAPLSQWPKMKKK